MKIKQTFNLNRLRCEIAMEQSLKYWPIPKPRQEIECPQCGSRSIGLFGWVKGKQKYRCKDCRRYFRGRPRWECSCSIPGQDPKCQDCPDFNQFLTIIKQKTEELKHLSQKQLEAFLDQNSTNRQ